MGRKPERISSTKSCKPGTTAKAQKKRIKVSSAKAKGRNLQHWACQKISDLTGLPWGKDEHIASREGGQSGVDVKLIGKARKLFPFSVECKNHKTWRIKEWIEQAISNCMPETYWLLILRKSDKIKKNRIENIVVMDANDFFELISRLGGFEDK